MGKIIDGRAKSQIILTSLKEKCLKLKKNNVPGLAVILVGDNEASKIYTARKQKIAKSIGFYSLRKIFANNISQEKLIDEIKELNNNKDIHGILVQLPLPNTIDTIEILSAIDPQKDVDGFHPFNSGLLSMEKPFIMPCTPKGCLRLIKDFIPSLAGIHAVVIGKSNIVGRPMAEILLMHGATVTITHILTKNLSSICKRADLIVSAAGHPHLVTKDFIKNGAVVIDVGITRLPSGQIVGDVLFEEAIKIANVTPVPGGVGPMTIASLMENTFECFLRSQK